MSDDSEGFGAEHAWKYVAFVTVAYLNLQVASGPSWPRESRHLVCDLSRQALVFQGEEELSCRGQGGIDSSLSDAKKIQRKPTGIRPRWRCCAFGNDCGSRGGTTVLTGSGSKAWTRPHSARRSSQWQRSVGSWPKPAGRKPIPANAHEAPGCVSPAALYGNVAARRAGVTSLRPRRNEGADLPTPG